MTATGLMWYICHSTILPSFMLSFTDPQLQHTPQPICSRSKSEQAMIVLDYNKKSKLLLIPVLLCVHLSELSGLQQSSPGPGFDHEQAYVAGRPKLKCSKGSCRKLNLFQDTQDLSTKQEKIMPHSYFQVAFSLLVMLYSA